MFRSHFYCHLNFIMQRWSFIIYILFILISLIDSVSSRESNVECAKLKKNSCSCAMSDGGIIDLSFVTTAGTWTFNASNHNDYGNATFYYNPCYPFSIQDAPICTDIALCKYNVTKNTTKKKISVKLYTDIGDFKNFQFKTDHDRKLYIHYVTNKLGRKIESFVYLKCDKHSTGFSFNQATSNLTYYNFTLSSPCACSNGCLPQDNTVYLSTGTILLIFFCVFVLTYFVVGMLYNKAIDGASGRDLIPNREFWASLPGLIKDGYCFFISPCTGRPVEYRSYEKL